MMPYRTPEQERQHKAEMMAALLVAAQANRTWDRSTGAEGLLAEIKRHSEGNERIMHLATIVLASVSVQALVNTMKDGEQ